MQNNPKVTVITVLIVLLLGIGGAYTITNKKYIFDAPEKPVDLPMSPDLPQKFEDFLNGFLKDVNDSMMAYKAERKILTEAIVPANMRDPSYIEENQKMVQALIPSLRNRIDGVVRQFEKADADIDALLLNQPELARQNILLKWNAVKNAQSETYIEYFTYESELLTAYGDLMTFYSTHRNNLETDLDSQDVIFKDPAAKAEEEKRLSSIKEIQALQSEALKRSMVPKDAEKPAQ